MSAHTHTNRPWSLCYLACLLFLLMDPTITFSQTTNTFPNKGIRIVVPYPPGGGADSNARLIAQKISIQLGQPIVIDNRPGASGVLGAELVLQSRADGYTLLFDTFPYAVNAVMRKLPFDPIKDLLPVSQAINMPLILVVPTSSAYKSIKELIDEARSHPGKLDYASYGAGGAAHLAAEMLKREAAIDWVHVPYKGGPPAVSDLLAGRVSAYFANPVSSLSYIRAERLRALATTGRSRISILPEIPTMIESGYKDFEVTEWNGLFTPVGTPPTVIKQLSQAVQEALENPDTRSRLLKMGIEPVGNSPEQFATFLKGQIERWSSLIKSNGIRAD